MNTTHWGRKETIVTPPQAPIYSYAAIALVLILTAVFLRVYLSAFMPPLERYDLWPFIQSGTLTGLKQTGQYQLLDVSDDLAQGVVVGQRVTAVRRQLADVVTRREDPGSGCGADDDRPDLGRPVLDEGRGQVIDQGHAQGVDRRAGQRDPGDLIADFDDD